MTAEARAEALDWLGQPSLLDALAADIQMAGLVGESDNAVVAYLAATSRKLPDPLAVLIQSSSAAGKSSLMDAFWTSSHRKTCSASRRSPRRPSTIWTRTRSRIASSPSPRRRGPPARATP